MSTTFTVSTLNGLQYLNLISKELGYESSRCTFNRYEKHLSFHIPIIPTIISYRYVNDTRSVIQLYTYVI